MSTKIIPEDVFVPGKYPLDTNNAYARRGEKEESFLKSISISSVPVIYGGFGVGKSSMALKLVKDKFKKNKLVYIESISEMTKDEIIKTILEEIDSSIIEEKTESSTTAAELGVDAEIKAGGSFLSIFKAVIAARSKLSISAKEKEIRKYITTGITDRKLIRLCDDAKVFLVLDELHKGTKEVIAWIPQLIKKYSNGQLKNMKICLLGTSSNPTDLVNRDPGIDRILSEIKVESFTRDESLSLIHDGMAKLGIITDEGINEKLVKCCVGSPYILQYILLDCSKKALSKGDNLLIDEYIKDSLQDYASTKAQRMIHQFRTASETTGEIRYRKNIMLAMASIEDEYATMESIILKINEITGRELKSSDISGSLRELKTERYGNILKDVEYPYGRGRVYNYSTFTDPAMKFIIRWIKENDMI
jgi:hypothetical protein